MESLAMIRGWSVRHHSKSTFPKEKDLVLKSNSGTNRSKIDVVTIRKRLAIGKTLRIGGTTLRVSELRRNSVKVSIVATRSMAIEVID